jgi:ribosome recycling factor
MPTLKQTKLRMDESMEAVRREFATVRTGKATPALLDTVRVDAYGAKMPLNQVATVSTPESALLVVQPFDKSLVGDIERAILTADLGLNPANDGAIIRIPIPPLNEERRKEYVRLLHKMAEDGRVSVRVARHKANDEIKALIKDHEISEDEGHRQLNEVQKMTDNHIALIDELLAKKEKEVLEI